MRAAVSGGAREAAAWGAVLGTLKFTAGTLKGIFHDLPVMVRDGLRSAPTALYNVALQQAQMWRAVSRDPAARAQLVDRVCATLAAAIR